MKAKTKNVVIILIIGLIFPLILTYNFNFKDSYQYNTVKPKTSAIYDFIIIDALASTNTTFYGNWSWARVQPWCTVGNGTKENPYIIEDVTIIYPPAIDCLTIKNSRKYFTVRNCTLKDIPVASFAGIRLENITNANIIDNQVYNNSYGINCLNVNNSQLISNNCSDNIQYGIFLQNCNYNNISGNTANGNDNEGIQISNCNNNTISENIANNNDAIGITLFMDCAYNTLSGNIANGNNFGIYLDTDNHFNLISGNTANDNNIDGIIIDQTSNFNNISGNTANRNSYGLYFGYQCNNNMISGNTFYDNEEGIYFDGECNFNQISGNIVNNNTYDGIYMYESDYNTISNNFVDGTGTGDYGISLHWYCQNNTIINNIATYNEEIGIELYDYCENNTVLNNIVSYNGLNGIGIYDLSDNNTLIENLLYNNTIGLYIDNGDNNTIYENYFAKNGKHAYDDGLENKWNSTIIGNYWDNHTGPDITPQDGIVDNPYMFIDGPAGSIDYFPIAEDGAPRITIFSPLEGKRYGSSAPSFNVEIVDLYVIEMWYTLDGGLNNYTFMVNGTINQAMWDALPEGSITITFYAMDIAGNLGFEVVIVIKGFLDGLDPGVIATIIVVSIGGVLILIGVAYMFLKKRKAPA
ncbi:MAG: right-handed parallel beta-helix repeat-containing protein [Promethearchaeota archaeon]|jgi:parallel beta-helix repeat protein